MRWYPWVAPQHGTPPASTYHTVRYKVADCGYVRKLAAWNACRPGASLLRWYEDLRTDEFRACGGAGGSNRTQHRERHVADTPTVSISTYRTGSLPCYTRVLACVWFIV